MSQSDQPGRRGFLGRAAALAGVSAALPSTGLAQPRRAEFQLPQYARAQDYKSLKQSSHDPTGGNADFWRIPPGGTQELFHSAGPGVISHLWFTISAQSPNHPKELVLRAYWEGNARPSLEAPIGDFFGLNLGQYQIYESAYLACSPGKSLNCYFAMPFRKSARLTVTNESAGQVGAFYSNIDYLLTPSLPDDALYFHAQYRQAAPCVASMGEPLNPTGAKNYVYLETRGRGHLMGVTLGVLLNADGWMGEGDDMIFVDDETTPAIIGTGSEDYFLGSWNFGGRDGATPFAHHYYGAPLIIMPERVGGRYCCYRWHGDNPVTFTRYLRHTMEHGHANDRGDNFFSVGYWYQTEPYTDSPPLPPAAERIPRIKPS
ncbi:MAG: glycoside hydrolase family 172 protein [Bryobacteraceae bacterium]|jgi:hypothetical protein